MELETLGIKEKNEAGFGEEKRNRAVKMPMQLRNRSKNLL